jgi:hypothetical protein
MYGNVIERDFNTGHDSAFFYKFSSNPPKAEKVLWLPFGSFIGVIDQARKWYISAGQMNNYDEVIAIDLTTNKIIKRDTLFYSFYSTDSLYRLSSIPYAMEYNPQNGKIYCLSQVQDVQKQMWFITLHTLDVNTSTITFIDSIPKSSLDLQDLQYGGSDFVTRCNAALDYDKGILWLSKNKDAWFSRFHTVIGIDIKTAEIVNTVSNDFYGMEYNPSDSLIYGIQDSELQDTVNMGYEELPYKQRILKKPILFAGDIFEWSYTFNPETRYFVIQGGIPNRENFHYIRFINFDNGDEIDIPLHWPVYHMRMLTDIAPLGIERGNSIGQNAIAYPNPAYSQLTISIPEEGRYPITAFVFNSIGQLVMTTYSQHNNFQLDVSALPEGVYVIRLSSQDKMMSTCFVKLGDR